MVIIFSFDKTTVSMTWEKFAKEAPQTKHDEQVILPDIHKRLLNGEKVEWNDAIIEVA